jgi:hypothetical protein
MAAPPPRPPSWRVRAPLAADTPVEVENRQIEAWRPMPSAEKAALVAGLTNATFVLARAGLRERFPDASDRELFLRLAIQTLGRDLAQRAYPDARSRADALSENG